MAEVMEMESAGHDIYVRHTDTDGRMNIRQHRVYNTGGALRRFAAEADRENAAARKAGKPAKAKVESVSEREFWDWRKAVRNG